MYVGDILSSNYVKLYTVRLLVRTNENFHILCKLEIKKNNIIRMAITTPIKREYSMLNNKRCYDLMLSFKGHLTLTSYVILNPLNLAVT